MVAARDIRAGETVLVEDRGPFVACPNLRSPVAVCLECFTPSGAYRVERRSDKV